MKVMLAIEPEAIQLKPPPHPSHLCCFPAVTAWWIGLIYPRAWCHHVHPCEGHLRLRDTSRGCT